MHRLLRMHWLLLLLTLILGGLGVAMLYSAAGGEWKMWAQAHFVRFLIGVFLILIITLIRLEFWFRAAYPLYALGVLLLVYVEFKGQMGMGAQRWIALGGMTIQPAEFMKIAVVLTLAKYFHNTHLMDRHHAIWMAMPLVIIGIPAALILKQPNLGTATILSATAAMIWFAAGVRWRWIMASMIVLVFTAIFGWQFLLHDYQKQRVHTFLDPSSDPLGAGYNIIQSIIAIGSGGLNGKGFMQGSQGQLDFLPEKHTDFIFTMLAEELGFLGGAGVLLAFAMLFFSGLHIAFKCEHSFGRFVVIGLCSFLWLHVMVNVAMVCGLIPVVGVPLPFLSYGGTIMLASCIAIGLMQNMWVHRKQQLGKGLHTP